MRRILILSLMASAVGLSGCETLRPTDPLVAGVESALKKDEHVGRFNLKAANDNGNITLTGDVNNEFQQWHSGTVAQKVSGVKKVDNQVKVK
jgi:osmotically-inducible protein OsmY